MSMPEQGVENSSSPPAAETLLQDDLAREQALRLSALKHAPPATIPGYDIRHCLGTGAYGSVWLACERNTGKQVAVKFYSHRRGLDWSLLNREVEKLAMLYTSREIVGLLGVGWQSEPPYYVMEYLQNGSLARLLDEGPLSVSEAVRIAGAVTAALVHAHAQGVLHCDVKPANVLLDGDFSPRLADFGQSRLSHEQSPALGTLFYMAPEQADLDANPNPRWDVYALGALLYHMLCGEPPLRTPENERRIRQAGNLEDTLATYRQIVEREPRPNRHREVRGVDARLAEIVDRCLSPDPAKRYADAAAVSQALAARARHQSLQPMIWLGIVLPGLLLVSLFPLALLAVSSAAGTSEHSLESRALESDGVAAKILAYSLDDDLTQRTRTLSLIAKDPKLVALVPGAREPAHSPARLKLQAHLSSEKADIDQIRRETRSDLDESWFLSDAQGVQRWRDPPSDVSFEGNFGWRDYFHGQGGDHPEWRGRTDIVPLQAPHISAPFRSSTTGHLKLALSAPVRDAEGQVIGVLSRTIALEKLLGSYKRLIGEDQRDLSGARVIALLDIRDGEGRVLDHPWMTADNLHKLTENGVYGRLTLEPAQRQKLAELGRLIRENAPVQGEHLDPRYFDPIRKVDGDAAGRYGGPWLAAFWPVGDTGLFAIVQEQRNAALGPVREIRDGLLEYGAAGLVLCVTLAATSWYFVRRVMRSEALVGARQPSGGRPGGDPTGSVRTTSAPTGGSRSV